MNMLSMLVVVFAAALQATTPKGEGDRQAIYRAVMQDGRCSGRGRPGAKGDRPVLVRERVNPREQAWWEYAPPPSLLDRLPKMIPGLRVELLREYLRTNAARSRFSETDARNLGVDIISRADVERMGKAQWFWTAFFERFPTASGLVELSAPAIDRKTGEALVYCSESTGALAGAGWLVMLEYDGSGWVPVFWQQLWVS